MVRKKLENEFSWSFSRHNIFEECPKKYWYTYYGSWEGWLAYSNFGPKKKADPLAAYLYAMKQMQSVPMYVGTVVHNSIEKTVKNYQRSKKWPELEDMILLAQADFEKGLKDCQEERWRTSPKKFSNFIEAYYPDTGKDLEALKIAGLEKVGRCITNWYNSSIRSKYLSSAQTSFVGVEELDSFYVDDIYKVWVVMDLATTWQQSDGEKYILFDWKSGKATDKTIDQLYTYALFAEKVWRVPHENIVISPFYLNDNNYIKIGAGQKELLSKDKMIEIENFIRSSCVSMVKNLVNENIKDNKANVLDYDYTDNSYRCRNCPFRQLCESVEYKDCDETVLGNSLPAQFSF